MPLHRFLALYERLLIGGLLLAVAVALWRICEAAS
jgi:hypothetical protein